MEGRTSSDNCLFPWLGSPDLPPDRILTA
jgi:hypothetical protein